MCIYFYLYGLGNNTYICIYLLLFTYIYYIHNLDFPRLLFWHVAVCP